MRILDLREFGIVSTPVSAPVCIIGGGLAGLTLASRLSALGVRCIVLESGENDLNAQTQELAVLEDPRGRYAYSAEGRHRRLGGNGAQWGGRILPMVPSDTGPRDYVGVEAWPLPASGIERFSETVEALLGVAPGSYEEDCLEAMDPRRLLPRNDPDFLCRWAKWVPFARCDLGKRLPQGSRSALAEIWLNATVVGFELEGDRVASLVATNAVGGHLRVTADRFVVAAGAVETTRLLLWLNAQSDERAFEGQPLGRYFQDHLDTTIARIERVDNTAADALLGYRFLKGIRRSLHLELSSAAQEADAVGSAFAYTRLDLTDTPMESIKSLGRSLQAGHPAWSELATIGRQVPFLWHTGFKRYGRHELYIPPKASMHLQLCIEQHPAWRNHIALSSARDGLGLPRARLDWMPDMWDERTFRAAARRLAAYWKRARAERYARFVWDKALADPMRSLCDGAKGYLHPSGTTRMGTDRTRSVVDADLSCHSIPNLSVLSTSVFPSSGSANPTFTLLRLACRLAEALGMDASRTIEIHRLPTLQPLQMPSL